MDDATLEDAIREHFAALGKINPSITNKCITIKATNAVDRISMAAHTRLYDFPRLLCSGVSEAKNCGL